MKSRLTCPHCAAACEIDDGHRGRQVRCGVCARTFLFEVAAAKPPAVSGIASKPSLKIPPPLPSRPSTASIQRSDARTPAASAAVPASAFKQPERLGRFEIREQLGAGGFGAVYRAWDPQLDRDIALKVPHASVLEDPEHVDRFFREARAAARLRHPHIVAVYDAGREGDQHFIASALIRGRALSTALRQETFDCRTAARIVVRLAEALDYAHGLGVVHRDVKSANVILDESGEPHLTDFGLARFDTSSERLTQDGTILGTPAYLAPEQARGTMSEITAASDQYSLGVVLYELLTGETPFSGPPEIVIFNVLNQEPPPPRSLVGRIPRDLETVCLKAMSKEPAGRYPSCREFGEDLQRWLAGEPIRARRSGLVEIAWRWTRRNRALAGLSAAVIGLSLALAVAIVFVVPALSPQRRPPAAAEAAAAEPRPPGASVSRQEPSGTEPGSQSPVAAAAPAGAPPMPADGEDESGVRRGPAPPPASGTSTAPEAPLPELGYESLPPAADAFADLGHLADEAFHNLAGWESSIENDARHRSDPTKRKQRLDGFNSLDLFISEPGVPYVLTLVSEEGAADDSFEVYINGSGPLYTYESARRRRARIGLRFITHRFRIDGMLVPEERVTVAFKNIASDNWGRSGVFYVRMDPINR